MGAQTKVSAITEHDDGRGPTGAGTNDRASQYRYDRAAAVRDILIIAVALAVITILHLYTDPSLTTAHTLYVRLYYLPILYAAFRFGAIGGLAVGMAAALTLAPHLQMDLGGIFQHGSDAFFEMLLYVVFGGLFGWLRDTETRRTEDLRVVSRELEAAYGKLEDRAVQLINIQEYTQAILRSVTAGVLTVGPEGSVATANPAAERIIGLKESEMVPRPIGMMFQDDGGLGSDVAKVLDGSVPRTARELTLMSSAGATIHAGVSVSRMRDIDGRILGAVVTLEDVSELKALTQQLIRTDRLAAMGELTAGVAHEVRNPLGIIRASVQLLEESGASPERTREATGVIKQEIDRLDKVIKALLDFGRPAPPALVLTDLEDVLREVVLFTRRFASRSDVELEEHYSGGLPETLADPNQLKQVFVNLISNAVQAMESEGGRIEVATGVDRGFVWARLSDTGPGIPNPQLDKVFDPFFSTRSDGTGLGLTIVHRIVDDHDGHIEVQSRPSGGTVFTVYLPVRVGARSDGVTQTVPPSPSSPSPND
jgi:two-component system, sporulation sensor kinase E